MLFTTVPYGRKKKRIDNRTRAWHACEKSIRDRGSWFAKKNYNFEKNRRARTVRERDFCKSLEWRCSSSQNRKCADYMRAWILIDRVHIHYAVFILSYLWDKPRQLVEKSRSILISRAQKLHWVWIIQGGKCFYAHTRKHLDGVFFLLLVSSPPPTPFF